MRDRDRSPETLEKELAEVRSQLNAATLDLAAARGELALANRHARTLEGKLASICDIAR